MNEDFKILEKVNREILFLSHPILKMQVPSRTSLDSCWMVELQTVDSSKSLQRFRRQSDWWGKSVGVWNTEAPPFA